MKTNYVVFPLCGCLLVNAFVCIRVARGVRVIDSYRSDVDALSLAVYQYTTNVESRLSTILVSSAPSSVVSSFSPTGVVSSIPFRYAVVRGVPGLTSGGASWYPVGSLMPYGVLAFCDYDFALFDDGSCYTLHRDFLKGTYE